VLIPVLLPVVVALALVVAIAGSTPSIRAALRMSLRRFCERMLMATLSLTACCGGRWCIAGAECVGSGGDDGSAAWRRRC